jgi:hypothetical protein
MDAMLTDLGADRPHPLLPAELDIFGRFVGSWDVRNRYFDEAAGEWRENTRTWLFGRILDGLGIQDTLRDETGVGTTTRFFDLSAGRWRVAWNKPVLGQFCVLTAHPHDGGIRQDGTDSAGRPLRWNFTDVTDDAFDWSGYISDDGGRTWRLEQEMKVSRRRRPG